jgi:hypothetical protein
MNKSFTVDDFYKYKHVNNKPIESLEPYLVTQIKKKKNCVMQESEIKAYLTTHIQKRNNDSNDEILYEKIQGLLNKLSNNNLVEISSSIRDLPYMKKKHAYQLCEKVIIKASQEPTFADIYAKLCNNLMPYYIKDISTTGEETNVYFRSVLIIICQEIIQELILDVKSVSTTYERTFDYKKIKLSGLCKFLGELYNYGIINEKIVEQCILLIYNVIINNKSSLDLFDPLSVFVISIMNKIYNTHNETYNKIIELVDNIRYEKNGFKFAKSIYKFKILEIYDEINKIKKKS